MYRSFLSVLASHLLQRLLEIRFLRRIAIELRCILFNKSFLSLFSKNFLFQVHRRQIYYYFFPGLYVISSVFQEFVFQWPSPSNIRQILFPLGFLAAHLCRIKLSEGTNLMNLIEGNKPMCCFS